MFPPCKVPLTLKSLPVSILWWPLTHRGGPGPPGATHRGSYRLILPLFCLASLGGSVSRRIRDTFAITNAVDARFFAITTSPLCHQPSLATRRRTWRSQWRRQNVSRLDFTSSTTAPFLPLLLDKPFEQGAKKGTEGHYHILFICTCNFDLASCTSSGATHMRVYHSTDNIVINDHMLSFYAYCLLRNINS